VALDVRFVQDIEQAIAGNLIVLLRTAAQHRTPDEAFCMGALVIARANTITLGGKWDHVAMEVCAALEQEGLMLQLLNSPLLKG